MRLLYAVRVRPKERADWGVCRQSDEAGPTLLGFRHHYADVRRIYLHPVEADVEIS